MRAQRFILLDGLRGLAAFGVMAFHFWQGKSPAAAGLWDLVDLFFLLSGFVLAPQLIGSKKKTRKSFMFARFVRLYPMLFAVIIFRILVQRIPILQVLFTFDPKSLKSCLAALALLQVIYLPALYFYIVLWSLSAEIFVNFLACFMKPTGRKLLLIVLLGMSLTALGYVTKSDSPFNSPFNGYIIPGRFFIPVQAFGRVLTGFYLGLYLRVHGIGNLKEARTIVKISKIILPIALTLLLPHSGYFLFLVQISFYFLVQQLASFDTRNLPPILTHVCVYLGKISYGVYLWHLTIGDLQIPLRIEAYCIKHFHYTPTGIGFSALYTILTIFLVILITELCLNLFERPIQKYMTNRYLKS